MRSVLLASATMLCCAMTEPQPIAGGDDRYRTVEATPGSVIQLVGAPGQTLMVRLPAGLEIFSVLVSDQDVMDPSKAPDDKNMLGGRPPSAEGTQLENRTNDGCSVTASLQVCIRNKRYVFFKPLIALTPQPVPVIALRPLINKEPQEFSFMFQIETGDANYYGVEVNMPKPAVPAVTAATSARRPWRDRAYIPPVAAAPILNNNQYRVDGDAAMMGRK